MAPPKRKKSLSKIRMRTRSHKRKAPAICTCSKCGHARQPHRVCLNCGDYNGRQVISVTVSD